MKKLPKEFEEVLARREGFLGWDGVWKDYRWEIGNATYIGDDNSIACIAVKELRLQMMPMEPNTWVCWWWNNSLISLDRVAEAQDYCECVFQAVEVVYGS